MSLMNLNTDLSDTVEPFVNTMIVSHSFLENLMNRILILQVCLRD
jgi:hypothetical protein